MSYNSVINACAQGGQVEQAAQWLQAMKDQGIEPDVKSYTSVINACAQGGQEVEQAVKWLQAMKDQGIEPDVVTYNIIINACAHGGQVLHRSQLYCRSLCCMCVCVCVCVCGLRRVPAVYPQWRHSVRP